MPALAWTQGRFSRRSLGGIRLFGITCLAVLCWQVLPPLILLACLLKLGLCYRLFARILSGGMQAVALGFEIWLNRADAAPTPDFWLGVAALLAVDVTWRAMMRVYAGNSRSGWLIASGTVAALAAWTEAPAGVAVGLALLVFGWLHCFLHEREEQGISYHALSRQDVLLRWAASWGRYWLPAWLAGLLLGWACGLRPPELENALPWGYFSGLQPALLSVAQASGNGWEKARESAQLLLIGVLPVTGLLGVGYLLPSRFVYRFLQARDEALLLVWTVALALILSTFAHGDAAHLARVGSLAFALGWVALQGWLSRRAR